MKQSKSGTVTSSRQGGNEGAYIIRPVVAASEARLSPPLASWSCWQSIHRAVSMQPTKAALRKLSPVFSISPTGLSKILRVIFFLPTYCRCTANLHHHALYSNSSIKPSSRMFLPDAPASKPPHIVSTRHYSPRAQGADSSSSDKYAYQ